VRDAVVDLDSIDQPGQGMALWMHATEVQAIHDALATAGTPIVFEPMDGPFGRTFTFADPDGYHVTLHDRA
jgi:predicted enzyme related to lactoylglutathione lyase